METFTGTICAFGFNYAPYDWLICAGQLLPIQSNTALFALLGTKYGGNGTSTFALPNLMGRVAISQGSNGQTTHNVGDDGGANTVTLLSSNLPPHTHPISVNLTSGGRASTNNPAGAYLTTSENGGIANYSTQPSTDTFMKSPTISLGNTGGTASFSVQDPYLVMNYCICAYGYFPQRD